MEPDEVPPPGPELQALQEQVEITEQIANSFRNFFQHDGVRVGGGLGVSPSQIVPERAQPQIRTPVPAQLLVPAAGCGGTGDGEPGNEDTDKEDNRNRKEDMDMEMELVKKENGRLEKKLKKQHARITDLEKQLTTIQGVRGQLEKQLSDVGLKNDDLISEILRLRAELEELKEKGVTASKGGPPNSSAAGGEGGLRPGGDRGGVGGSDQVNNQGQKEAVVETGVTTPAPKKGPTGPSASSKPGSQHRQNEGKGKATVPGNPNPAGAARKVPPNHAAVANVNLAMLKFANAPPVPITALAMYRCGPCGVRFLTEGDLRAHLNSHMNNLGTVFRMGAKYKCEKCSLSFTSQTDFVMHNVLQHRFSTSSVNKG